MEAKADPKAGAPPLLLKLVRRAVRDELGETISAALVFRRNSIATKLATSVAKLYGRRWVADLLSEPIAEICAAARAAGAEACALEVDPEKMVAETVEAKLRRLEHAGSGGDGGAVATARSSRRSKRRSPAACSASSIGSSRRPTRRRPRSPSSSSSSAARSSSLRRRRRRRRARRRVGVFFLRFLVPALSAPSRSLLGAPPPRNEGRGLVLVAKAGSRRQRRFGAKEPFMAPLNPLIRANSANVAAFLDRLSGADAAGGRRRRRPAADAAAGGGASRWRRRRRSGARARGVRWRARGRRQSRQSGADDDSDDDGDGDGDDDAVAGTAAARRRRRSSKH